MRRNPRPRTISPATVLLALVLLTAATCAWAAKDFPVKGTMHADTIEIHAFHGPNNELVEVIINGEHINYLLPESQKDWIVEGLAGDDTISIKAPGPFIVKGGDGEDTLLGGAYDDVLIGGSGGDTIRGFAGHDWISGDAHKDHLYGGEGNDVIYGNAGEDTIRGGPGGDLIDGGDGDDTIWGENNNDQLYGEAGNDRIFGGPGDDLIFGGAGNDILRGDDGDDLVLGDSGNDKIEGSSVMNAEQYENQRKLIAKGIEVGFGVEVGDGGRKWTIRELGFLKAALETLPNKVLDMWDGRPEKLTYMRKELFSLGCLHPYGTDYGASGLTSTAIWIYDLGWANPHEQVQDAFVATIIHETGHAYRKSPALTASQWKDWKALSGWADGQHDPNAHFVNDYAKTNADEDWAVSFEHYF
ncbi:MAG: calcium-binding protein, partial [Armatimonadetes bacterium]|nr:calcium-binding protein [Armatimonadota bacterium]